MLHTVQATIEEDGTVRLDEPVVLRGKTRALVTILDTVDWRLIEPAILSEAALAGGWSGPEEDAAWANAADLPDIGDDDE